jgi:DNA-binding transcriptional ArsR family regulator
MTDEDVAQALAAIGHAARLRVFRLLVQAGPEGVTAGALAEAAALPASTLAHHLRVLCEAGLATQRRQGRQTITWADYAALRRVLGHVEERCCAGLPGVQGQRSAPFVALAEDER